MLDHTRLEGVQSGDLYALRERLKKAGYESSRINALTGKEVTRYVNINELERYLLRTQVLYGHADLKDLVEFFLLDGALSPQRIVELLGEASLHTLSAAGMLEAQGDLVSLRAYVAPLESRFFLNDGMRHVDNQGHVLTLVLEQAYIVRVGKLLRDRLGNEAKRILDICCGSGVIGQAVARADDSVLGIDINPRAVAYANFNGRLNGLNARAEICNICDAAPEGQFDLILTNPPYNGFFPVAEATEQALNLTLHAGTFGDVVCNGILDKLDAMLAPGGCFAMIGILLMKDGRLAHPLARQLEKRGGLSLLHGPVHNAQTWEGLRLLFNCTPAFDKIPAGAIIDALGRADYFNQVTWGIMIYSDKGKPGWSPIYNLATDAVLINDLAEQAVRVAIS